MLAGSIANDKLTNSSVTVGTTAIALGASSTTLAGLTSVTSTSFVGALTGNASTVTNGVYTTNSYADPTWITSLAYSKLTGVPAQPTPFTFNVAADDSTLRTISSEETIKFVGAGGITTASDAEGTITITQGVAAAGTLSGSTLASGVTASSLTSVGTLTGVTSNAVTAFTAGDAAISGVALQVPREGAIRNLYNGAGNNMYFDVSIGGASNGQFQFRSSSSFTNVLTMSPTAFNVNPEAVVTAKTASFGRLPWNSAIDTELTIDDYRWRITNSGGIYAQVISNTGGTKNSAWTAVAAISGSAVAQGGSTGALLPNNSWTTLYTFGSMANAGDTVTVTFQDKNLGRIYRITFMRSDNGSTTGYNIVAERLL
jgi:hypothetical protein